MAQGYGIRTGGLYLTRPTWKGIWTAKTANGTDLRSLLDASGYDSAFCSFSEEDWIARALHLMDRLGAVPGDSVLEIGCGAGAFLKPLNDAGYMVAGTDLSARLVEAARAAMPEATFWAREANSMPDGSWDHVISHGCFFYFPHHGYAEETLTGMLERAKKSVGVFDVPDLATRDEDLKRRKQHLNENAPKVDYDGLAHLYFEQDWFHQRLEPLSTEVFQLPFDGYTNAPYRFHVAARKV